MYKSSISSGASPGLFDRAVSGHVGGVEREGPVHRPFPSLAAGPSTWEAHSARDRHQTAVASPSTYQHRCGDVRRGLAGNEDDIMASVFADELGWLADVVAARGMSINDGSGGER